MERRRKKKKKKKSLRLEVVFLNKLYIYVDKYSWMR
jgi:hypothetical protein